VAALITILAVSVLAAACANSNDAEPASPAASRSAVTPEAAESQQVNDQGLFLRVIAPL
jgi:nitrous oxide reductase accessory protein NosL